MAFSLLFVVWNTAACLAQELGLPLPSFYPLTSTFCEYRTGHFHAGLDFSTGGRIGVPVLAVGPGSVSRIRVSGTGYGKAVYVSLDNGTTAVYGHLDGFSDRIQSLALSKQLESGQYELDLAVAPGELGVSAGELLGYSGDTGASSGPHLHFELRRDDTSLNPLPGVYSFDDHVRPTFRRVRLVPVGPYSEVDGRDIPVSIYVRDPSGSGAYSATRVPRVTGRFLVGASVFDRTEAASNMLAVYETKLFLDDSLIFWHTFEEIEASRTHEVELAYDLGLARVGDRYSLNLCRFEGSRLSSLRGLSPGAGIVDADALLPRGIHTLRIEARDAAGNSSTASVRFMTVRRPYANSLRAWREGDSLAVEATFTDPDECVESVVLGYGLGSLSGESETEPMREHPPGSGKYFLRIPLPGSSTGPGDNGVVGIVRAEARVKGAGSLVSRTLALLGGRVIPGASVQLDVNRKAESAEIRARVEPWFLRPRIGLVAADTAWLKVTEEERGVYVAKAKFTHFLSGGGVALCVVEPGGSRALVASKPISIRLARRDSEGAVEASDGLMAFRYGMETFYKDTYVSIERIRPEVEATDDEGGTAGPPGGTERSRDALAEGLSLVSDVFSVAPDDVVFDKEGTVVIRCPGGTPSLDRVAVYRRQSGLGWAYVGAAVDSVAATVSARVRTFCDFALIRDERAPAISAVRPRVGAVISSRRPDIRAKVRDVGSGVEWKGMSVTIDGKSALCVWEPRYARLSVVHTGLLEPGRHHVMFQVVDRVGNQSSAETWFTVSR